MGTASAVIEAEPVVFLMKEFLGKFESVRPDGIQILNRRNRAMRWRNRELSLL